MGSKIGIKCLYILFFTLFLFLQSSFRLNAQVNLAGFDSLRIIEEGETPEIFVSSSILIIGDTADIYFKHTMPDGTLTDFPANQLFRILLTSDMENIFDIISKDEKIVTNGLVQLPLKVFAKGPGRVHFNVYAINPGEFPDSTHRTLTAPNNLILAKYTGEMGINKLHLHEYENARKYFLEAAKLDSMQRNSCYYNIACAYALENDTTNALLYLRLAFENGFDDYIHALKDDKDLASIRHSPSFIPIITMTLNNERTRLLDENKKEKETYSKGVNYFRISETYLKQADPDSFFVWFEKAMQNKYCPEAGYFSDSLFNMICNDNRLDSLLTYYSETAGTINIPSDIISLKPYLAKKMHLYYIPDFIGNCYNLNELWVKGDPVKKIPLQIVNCKSLASLKIENSGFDKFPNVITKIPSLKSLTINNGKFSIIPDDISGNYNLDTLYLINDGISTLSKSLGELTKLKYLNLQWNYITNLPEDLEKIKSLNYLNLSGNSIKNAPDFLFRYGTLTYLDLHENLIERIPPEIKHLKKLNYLDLSLNNLTSLPDELCSLNSLEYLDVSFNNLTDLPAEIFRLKSLKKLVVFGNKISAEKVKSLKTVLPDCHIIGEVQNSFSYKKFTNPKIVTDTLKNIVFSYPEEYKVEFRMPEMPFMDTVISIEFTKLTPLDSDAVLYENNDSTEFFVENTCTVNISVTDNNFSSIAGSFDFQKNDFLINGNKSENYLYDLPLWVSIGRHNHESEPGALNQDNWKGLFGPVEWWSRVVTKTGVVGDEEEDDVHDFYKAVAVKKMENGQSLFIFVTTDIDAEEDILGNLLNSVKYIGK